MTVALPFVVDGRGAARDVLLGLRGYERALLAAHYADRAPLHLLVDAQDEAAAKAFVTDRRLRGVGVELHTDEAALRARVGAAKLVDGACVFDAVAAKALAEGETPAEGGARYGDGFFLPAEAKRKAGRLLRSLENPCDGLVDTWLNRPLSRLMTRAMVPTGISPNAVTLLSFAVGMLGAGLIATGFHVLAIVGALVFQLSAAIDCVDGEIARLTYRFSPFGARLDLALDNVVHVFLFAALGWASVPALGKNLALFVGVVAALGGLFSFLVVYRLTFEGEGEGSSPLRGLLDRVTNRDFSLLVIAAAWTGRLHWLLIAIAVGTHLFWPVLLLVARRRRS